jgi:hypothetical protein
MRNAAVRRAPPPIDRALDRGDRPDRKDRAARIDAPIESIRRYSLNSLLQAACRVYQRGMEVYHDNERALRRGGVSGLFDLSDIASGPVTGRWRRLSA